MPDSVTPADSPATLLCMMAEQVARIKQHAPQVSETWPPTEIQLIFIDKRDDKIIGNPGIFSEDVTKANNVVDMIKTAFDRAGIPATIRIGAADDWRDVTSQEDWNEAVFAVWERYGDGATVVVQIRV